MTAREDLANRIADLTVNGGSLGDVLRVHHNESGDEVPVFVGDQRTADALLAEGYRPPPRTITTVEELAELLEDNDRAVTLADVSGYLWWSEYTSEAGNILVGCASPKRPLSCGMAGEFWGNAMRPAEAIAYGPFTLIRDSQEEQP